MDAQEAAIRRTVAGYVTDMTRGDTGLLARAFHPRGVPAGHFENQLEWLGVEKFAASCVGPALPRDVPEPPSEIEELRRSGDTAVVIVTNVWAG